MKKFMIYTYKCIVVVVASNVVVVGTVIDDVVGFNNIVTFVACVVDGGVTVAFVAYFFVDF